MKKATEKNKAKRLKIDLKALKLAKTQGRLYLGRHETDGDYCCDFCGKVNPTYVLSVLETAEEANSDMESDPIYLEGEPCYLVGAGCLKEILVLLADTSGSIVKDRVK